jgi:hypothetical protein
MCRHLQDKLVEQTEQARKLRYAATRLNSRSSAH